MCQINTVSASRLFVSSWTPERARASTGGERGMQRGEREREREREREYARARVSDRERARECHAEEGEEERARSKQGEGDWCVRSCTCAWVHVCVRSFPYPPPLFPQLYLHSCLTLRTLPYYIQRFLLTPIPPPYSSNYIFILISPYTPYYI